MKNLKVVAKRSGLPDVEIFNLIPDDFQEPRQLEILMQDVDNTNKSLFKTVFNPDVTDQPPQPTGSLLEYGIKALQKTTGKFVELKTGNDHPNGQRYSVNHRFLNYMMIGYFKLGKGQDVMEMKTDGPNHGGCNKAGGIPDSEIQDCCWCEVNISLTKRKKYKAGQFYISSEHPHPVNFDAPDNIPSAKIVQLQPQQWIGYAVAAWQQGEFRHLQGYVDPDPFNDDGTVKNKWILGVDEVDTGQLTTPKLAKRSIPINHVKNGKVAGLECEIRMNNATHHDCQIKWARVYEIVPPV